VGAEPSTVLRIRDLKTYFFTYDGVVRALDGVTFSIRKGETLGLVGETGCGKSVTAFSVTRLVSDPPGRIISGEIWFRDANLLWNLAREAKIKPIPGTVRAKVRRRYRMIKRANARISAVRGSEISMIFQEPMSALNPVFTITHQLGEVIELHKLAPTAEAILCSRARVDLKNYPEALAAVSEAVREPGHPHLEEAANRLASAVGLPDAGREIAQTFASTSGAVSEGQWASLERTLNVRFQERLKTCLQAILDAAKEPGQPRLRRACRDLSDLVGLASVQTEVFYMFRGVTKDPERNVRLLERTLRRLSLSPYQRRYIEHRVRLSELLARRKGVYLEEMRRGRELARERQKITLQIWAENLKTFWLSLPFFKRHTHYPLEQEIFWQTVRLLEGVGIANPVQVARGYPHELSGGMIQRVMISMALAPEPALLIADEPTTALDVTIQAQILDLMKDLKHRVGTSILLITHDLGVVAEVCDRVCVMYAGNIVEVGEVKEIFAKPLHPYSQGLLASIPRMDDPNKRLESIPGSVPNLIYPPSGCRFHPRCAFAMEKCKTLRPPMTREGPNHLVACWLYSGPEVKDY
jgi:oligopeptide/dipeptide ABC transporter ATP-binding protein